MGGIAALSEAATNLLALVVFATLLAPKGFGAADADPSQIVALLADNQAWLRVWYEIQIWLAWLGVVMLRSSTRVAAKSTEAFLEQLSTTT